MKEASCTVVGYIFNSHGIIPDMFILYTFFYVFIDFLSTPAVFRWCSTCHKMNVLLNTTQSLSYVQSRFTIHIEDLPRKDQRRTCNHALAGKTREMTEFHLHHFLLSRTNFHRVGV